MCHVGSFRRKIRRLVDAAVSAALGKSAHEKYRSTEVDDDQQRLTSTVSICMFVHEGFYIHSNPPTQYEPRDVLEMPNKPPEIDLRGKGIEIPFTFLGKRFRLQDARRTLARHTCKCM